MVIKDFDSRLRYLDIILKIGVFIVPSFFLLDYVYYPEYKYTLLAIRLCLSAYYLFVLFLIPNVSARYHDLLICLTFFLSAFSFSFICVITGDGFASPYCIAILQLNMVAILMFNMEPKYYVFMICSILIQHFVLLSFLPWELKDMMVNVFGVAFFSGVSIIIQLFIHNAVNEIRALRGIIPICAKCKKIRDDSGYWHQVESYISARSEAVFSHGICPHCMELLYPEYCETVREDKV